MNNSAKPCVWQHPLLRSPRAARMRPTFDPPPALCLQNCLGTTAYDIGNVFRQEVSKRGFFWFLGFFQKERTGFYFSSDTFIAFELIQFWWKAEACPCGFHDLVKAARWSRAWGAETPPVLSQESAMPGPAPARPLAGPHCLLGASSPVCTGTAGELPPAVLQRQGNRGQLPAKRLRRCHLPSAGRWVRMEKCSGTEQLLERWAGWVTRLILQIL